MRTPNALFRPLRGFVGTVRLQGLPNRRSRARGNSRGRRSRCLRPEQHDLYNGHYILSGNRVYMVGGLNDAPGFDHLGNDAANVKPVAERSRSMSTS